MPEKPQPLNHVGGEFVAPAEGGWSDVVDPATGEVYASAPLSTAPDVDAAYAAAGGAFATWKRTTPGERMEALRAMAGAVEAGARRLVATEARNTGKPVGLTTSEEIPPMVDQIRFFAGAARMLEGRVTTRRPTRRRPSPPRTRPTTTPTTPRSPSCRVAVWTPATAPRAVSPRRS